MNWKDIVGQEIKVPSETVRKQVKAHWDGIAKPLDSLGDFETIFCKIGAIQEQEIPQISKRAVVMMISDNGVVAEGISQSGQDVTLAVAKAMGSGTSSVCKMAKTCGADTIPVDAGINAEETPAGVLNHKIMQGTRNFAKEPAMTEEEAQRAILAGIEVAKACKDAGYTILATGEMGIGNTTTSVAVAAALLGEFRSDMVGRGAGLSDEGTVRKRRVIEDALSRYGLLGGNVPCSPLEALRTVGGLDIAGLCGVFIGGALFGIPVVIDGVISATAGLLAERLMPNARHYMIASHAGKEPMLAEILAALGLEPVLLGKMGLGEGCGAVMLFPLLDMAMSLYADGNSFLDIAVEQYERLH